MHNDVEELLLKRKQQLKENPNLLKRKWIEPYSPRIKNMLDLDIPLPMIKSWLHEKKAIKITLQTLRNYVVKEFGEDFYKEYCLRNGWQKTKKNQTEKKHVEPIEKKSAVKVDGVIPVPERPVTINHVSEEELEKLLNTHFDPKDIPRRPLPDEE
ncbi:MAG: hypothetical protein Q8K59_13375 [Nitrosomonas sp.]|nr:hypothetical protein [Moraxellaceae bacterium]MDP1952047.1 hypothetical protein [Nitrosomonas sp.]